MLKSLLLSALLAATPIALHAGDTMLKDMPAGDYTIDLAHTSVTWKVSHLGLSNYTARFADISGTLTLDPKDPTQSKVIAVINPASVRTDYPHPEKKDFDKKLAEGEEWFNVGKFPEITFRSTRVEQTGDAIGKIHGDLTLLGVTKPVTLDVRYNGAFAKMPFADVPAVGFSATTTIKRSEWGMGTYVPNIGDNVTVAIEAEFHKAP